MSGSVTDGTTRRPRYWTIVEEGPSRPEVFTVDSDGYGEALVVFGFEEEAEMFLALEEMGAGWRIHETTAGELVSLLHGPCAGVDRVEIDPLPRRISDRTDIHPLSVSSTNFARALLDANGSTAAGGAAMPALASLRP